MSSRSNWEVRTASRLPQDTRSYTERLEAARNRTVNEAIKVPTPTPKVTAPTESTPKATPGLLGDGAAARAMRAIRSRRPE